MTYRERIFAGEKIMLLDALRSTNPNAAILGIASVVKNKSDDDDILNAIKNLKESRMIILGYSISELAIAALDLIDAEKYDGEEKKILGLIESRFEFCPEVQAQLAGEQILDEFIKTHPEFKKSHLKLSVIGDGIMIIRDLDLLDNFQIIGLKKPSKPWIVGDELEDLKNVAWEFIKSKKEQSH